VHPGLSKIDLTNGIGSAVRMSVKATEERSEKGARKRSGLPDTHCHLE
jgi:hypothetical protein